MNTNLTVEQELEQQFKLYADKATFMMLGNLYKCGLITKEEFLMEGAKYHTW